MKEKLTQLLQEGRDRIAAVRSEAELQEVKALLLGKQGSLTGLLKELPKLDNHRTCEDIELAGTPYMFEAKENNTVLYQVTLKITYTREREVEDEW